MAKVKFGSIVTDMRNKLGSTVYSKNRYGAYARSYKTSVPSSTAAQIVVRNRLSGFSMNWRNLTDEQRTAWNDAVPNFKHTDIFGSLVNPSGFDLYIRLNVNLDQIGQPAIDSPPIPGVLLSLDNIGISADAVAPLVAFEFSPSPVPAGYSVVIMATACISPGKSYVKNLVRQIAIIDEGATSNVDLTADYIAKFTTITTGQRISICVIVVNKSTGQKSPPMYSTCIVGSGIGLDFNQALDTGIPLG